MDIFWLKLRFWSWSLHPVCLCLQNIQICVKEAALQLNSQLIDTCSLKLGFNLEVLVVA